MIESGVAFRGEEAIAEVQCELLDLGPSYADVTNIGDHVKQKMPNGVNTITLRIVSSSVVLPISHTPLILLTQDGRKVKFFWTGAEAIVASEIY